MKLSFKKQPRETGLRSITNPHPCVDIKCDNKRFGNIIPASWSNRFWRVQYAVDKTDINEDGNPNCSWALVFPKERFESEEDARAWVKKNWPEIQSKKLHFFED